MKHFRSRNSLNLGSLRNTYFLIYFFNPHENLLDTFFKNHYNSYVFKHILGNQNSLNLGSLRNHCFLYTFWAPIGIFWIWFSKTIIIHTFLSTFWKTAIQILYLFGRIPWKLRARVIIFSSLWICVNCSKTIIIHASFERILFEPTRNLLDMLFKNHYKSNAFWNILGAEIHWISDPSGTLIFCLLFESPWESFGYVFQKPL